MNIETNPPDLIGETICYNCGVIAWIEIGVTRNEERILECVNCYTRVYGCVKGGDNG